MSQTFTAPVQEEVKMYCEFGENRMVDNGLSSPNCDPRLLNVWHKLIILHEDGRRAHLQLGKDFFSDIDDFR